MTKVSRHSNLQSATAEAASRMQIQKHTIQPLIVHPGEDLVTKMFGKQTAKKFCKEQKSDKLWPKN